MQVICCLSKKIFLNISANKYYLRISCKTVQCLL